MEHNKTIKIYNNLQMEDLENEFWVDMIGFDGFYEVSNLGRIKSLSREYETSRGIRRFKERIRKQTLNKDGRLSCNISCNNIKTSLNIQAIIFLSFNPNAEYNVKSNCVMHIDKNKSNNKLSNLKIEKISNSHKINFKKGLTNHLIEIGKERTKKYNTLIDRICTNCNKKKKINKFERGRRKCYKCHGLSSYNRTLKNQGKKRVNNTKIYITDTFTKEVFVSTNKNNCVISKQLINRYANTKKPVIPYRNSKHINPLLVEIRQE